MFLAVELKKLVDFVDAKKTLKNDEELIFTIESLVEEFPTMKLEEFALIFRRIKQGKFGKLYERLKLAEISECCKQYEAEERSQILENMHKYDQAPAQRTSIANQMWNEARRRGSVNLSDDDLRALGEIK